MKQSQLLIIPIILGISGCAHEPMPTFTSESDLIQYTEQFIATTPPTHGPTPLELAFPDEPKIRSDTDVYRRINTSYCAVKFASSYLTKNLETRCKEQEGEILGDWCADPVTLEPLFKMYARSSGESEKCPKSKIEHEVSNIDIIYPKMKGEDWNQAALNLGYLNRPHYYKELAEQRAIAAEREEKQRLEQLKKEQNEERLRKEKEEAFKETKLKMLTTIGLQICKYNEDRTSVHVGYIVKAGADNIKIDVQARMFLLSFSSSDQYIADTWFKPQTIWDIPENWVLCG